MAAVWPAGPGLDRSAHIHPPEDICVPKNYQLGMHASNAACGAGERCAGCEGDALVVECEGYGEREACRGVENASGEASKGGGKQLGGWMGRSGSVYIKVVQQDRNANCRWSIWKCKC